MQGNSPSTPAVKAAGKEVFHILEMKIKEIYSNCETRSKILCAQQLVIRLRSSLDCVTVIISSVKLDQIHLGQAHFIALSTPVAFSGFIVVACKRPIYSVSVG